MAFTLASRRKNKSWSTNCARFGVGGGGGGGTPVTPPLNSSVTYIINSIQFKNMSHSGKYQHRGSAALTDAQRELKWVKN